MLLLTTLLLVLSLTVSGHSTYKRLPDAWYQDSDSPVHTLFSRGSEDATYAPVGSPGKIVDY